MSALLLPELLAHIFEQTCRVSDKAIRPNAAPLVLSRVCSLWHATALATPRLWSSFALTSKHWSDQANNLTLLSTYLRHSGALPLDIYIEFDASDPYYPRDLNDPTPFLRAISRHCGRWRTLTLKLPVDAMKRFVDQLGKTPAPQLVSLRLQETLSVAHTTRPVSTTTTTSTDPTSQPTDLVPWDIASEESRPASLFPSLRQLALSWVPHSTTVSLFPIEHITELSLVPHYNHKHQLTPPDAASLLSHFNSLTKLSLSISELQHTPTNPLQLIQLLQSVTLHHLVHLHLSGHPVAVSELWSMFHKLPQLRKVGLTYPANDPYEEGFRGLLERSGRMLKDDEEDDDDGYGDDDDDDGSVFEIVARW